MKFRNTQIFRLILLFISFIYYLPTFSQINEVNEGQSVKYKAIFLYEFTDKATWPDMDASKTFRVGIMNNEELALKFEEYAEAKEVNGGNFEVIRITDISNITSFHMVYVNDPLRYPIERIYQNLGFSPVLVVTNEYRDDECMVNFMQKGQRIKFTLNEEEIEKQKIIVSLELKKLAIQTYSKITYPRDPFTTVNRKSSNEYKKKAMTRELNNAEFDKIVSELKSELDQESKKVTKKESEISSLKTNINDLEISVEQKQSDIERVQELIRTQSEELDRLSLDIYEKEAEYQENLAKIKESEAGLIEAEKILANTKAELSSTVKILNNQKLITYLIILVLIIIGVLGGISYKNYRKQKSQAAVISEQKNFAEEQRDEIMQQHVQLEEKTKEITDSINYAKRIQDAILPPLTIVNKYLKDYFILYKPKDIVAGDFYWVENKNDLVLFAAADCTGHGVPGAMVSVLCSNALNRAVNEFGLTQPAKILDKTLEIVLEQFENSKEEVRDGMDIAICSFQPSTRKLEYAGAQNPLWIVKGGDAELIEIKADKQPIGRYSTKNKYTNHNLTLDKGDLIYLSSDGYADQFGGERGKKFKSVNFKKLLTKISSKPLQEQYQILNDNFKNWKGDLEQLDDVCVLGFKA